MLAARKRLLIAAGASLAIAGLITGCTADGGGGNNAPTNNAENEETGETVTIGFSGPAADHGWLGAINSAAIAEAAKYPDIDLKVAEGTNDANLQISQVETFINDGVDAIVLLPTDGAALTDVAIKAMEAGIPVINVDREFSSTFAARVTILGDNYGMGVSAGTYICEQFGDNPDAIVAEVAGIDSLPLTQDRSRGFADALDDCGLEVNNRVAADFTVAGGEAVTSQLLAAAPHIDALWNHDDDQGVGVMAALDAAGRERDADGRRRRLEERDGRHQGRQHRSEGDDHLPVDAGCRRHPPRAPRRAGQGDVRPRRGRGAEPDRAERTGRHQGERGQVPAHGLRVLTSTTSTGARLESGRAPAHFRPSRADRREAL